MVGIDTYGESAPAGVLFKHFGFTAENVADTVRTVLRGRALSPRLRCHPPQTEDRRLHLHGQGRHRRAGQPCGLPGSLSYFENSKKGQLGCRP